jgi:conjugal transfer/type IV secretion protein DotA/TraY
MAMMPFSPCPPLPAICTDQSVGILQQIFGPAIMAIAQGTNPSAASASTILPLMFQFFNSGILIVGSIIVSYVALVGVMHTANDGEAFGSSWSTLWTPMRIVAGGAVLLPTTSGYSFIQLIVMTISMWGVGFANGTYNAGFGAALVAPAGVVKAVNQPGSYYGLREFGKQYMKASYCAAVATDVYTDPFNPTLKPDFKIPIATTGAFAGFYQPDRIVAKPDGVTDYFYEVKDRNPLTKVGDGEPICGVVALSEYLAPVTGNAAVDAVELLRDAVLLEKFMEVSVTGGMMDAIDQWVATWPKNANDPLWTTFTLNGATLNNIIKTSEDNIFTAITASVATSQGTLDAQMPLIATSMNSLGWASAGGWFQRVGMLRGKLATIFGGNVGNVTSPSFVDLPVDATSSLLKVSVASTTQKAIDRAEDPANGYTASTVLKPEDLGSMIPQDPSVGANLGAVQADMTAKMSSYVSRIMLTSVEMATGASETGTTPLCGTAGQVGGSLNRMKCVGDYFAVAHLGLFAADVTIKTAATAVRVAAGVASAVPVVGPRLEAMATPLWDWLLQVPLKQMAMLNDKIEILAVYFGVLLPSMPYTIFMIVVVGWVLGVLQCIIAAPLWAVMHMTPEKSFIGSQQHGYILLLGLFVRPALAVLGLFAAMLVSDPIITFIAEGFFSMRGAIVSSTGNVGYVAEFMTFAWWYMAFGACLLPVLYMCFGLPQALPDVVLAWVRVIGTDMGSTTAATEARHGNSNIGRAAGALAGAQAGGVARLGSSGKGGGSGGNNPVNAGPSGVGGGGGSSGGGAPRQSLNQKLAARKSGNSAVNTGGQGPAPAQTSAADTRRAGQKVGEALGMAVGTAAAGDLAARGRSLAASAKSVVNGGRQGAAAAATAGAGGASLGRRIATGVRVGAAVAGAGIGAAMAQESKDHTASLVNAGQQGKAAFTDGADAVFAKQKTARDDKKADQAKTNSKYPTGY